eukprot:scaffold25351_cov15-Tisochrysis_lutea.AAC.1
MEFSCQLSPKSFLSYGCTRHVPFFRISSKELARYQSLFSLLPPGKQISWVSMWESAVMVWKEESKSGCFEGLHVDGLLGEPWPEVNACGEDVLLLRSRKERNILQERA